MVKQTKEEFLKEVRDCASQLDFYKEELITAQNNSPLDYHRFHLDRELQALADKSRQLEIETYKLYIETAQLCNRKLADVK